MEGLIDHGLHGVEHRSVPELEGLDQVDHQRAAAHDNLLWRVHEQWAGLQHERAGQSGLGTILILPLLRTKPGSSQLARSYRVTRVCPKLGSLSIHPYDSDMGEEESHVACKCKILSERLSFPIFPNQHLLVLCMHV